MKVQLQHKHQLLACGTIFYAYAFLFKLVGSDSNIIGIIKCPDNYNDEFFVEGNNYLIFISNAKDVKNEYTLINPYDKKSLPTYLVNSIIKL